MVVECGKLTCCLTAAKGIISLDLTYMSKFEIFIIWYIIKSRPLWFNYITNSMFQAINLIKCLRAIYGSWTVQAYLLLNGW